MAENTLSKFTTLAQILSVVVGVVVSVLSFNATRQKEAEARKAEAVRPFMVLRQEIYRKTVETAAVLANPDTHTPEEVQKAKRDFRNLYVAELSMVEARDVENNMVALARQVDPELASFTPAQSAAYNLAHALRDSFIAEYGIQP